MFKNTSISMLLFICSVVIFSQSKIAGADEPSVLRVLNFQADNGFQHQSKSVALAMVETLGDANGWKVVSTIKASSLTSLDLNSFDVVVFNNNCGNNGAIMTMPEQKALQQFVRKGGGFVGVHCAGAIWKEGGEFQPWYEGLIGTKLIDHPKVQQAKLMVEDRTHVATRHLPAEWTVTDEWHRFGSNPRANVNVLISVDEDSYQGEQKMGGDHPFTWCQQYDGGRSFFTSLGHTKEIYADKNFQKLIEGAIVWAGTKSDEPTQGDGKSETKLPIAKGLFLDLNADQDVQLKEGTKQVESWRNQVTGNAADLFVKRDEGRKVAGSGMPELKSNVATLAGHGSLVFNRQELVNMDEDAFDHLLTGDGYTWFSVMCIYKQKPGKPNVNSFFGNLRNGQEYEGFWGNLMDDHRVWMGSRNGVIPEGPRKLWDEKQNPQVVSKQPLDVDRYYLVMGRMGAGKEVVELNLYVNSTEPVDTKSVPVNPKANPSKMAIGQERDATNHPGYESFCGEIARMLIFERPLSDEELQTVATHLIKEYGLDVSKVAGRESDKAETAPKN